MNESKMTMIGRGGQWTIEHVRTRQLNGVTNATRTLGLVAGQLVVSGTDVEDRAIDIDGSAG